MSRSTPYSIPVERCRRCTSRYDFRLPNSQIVTIICGRPLEIEYKTVSYLWEDVSLGVNLNCSNCSKVKWVPMRNAEKLWKILEFVGGGSVVWLDALSIDQDDPADLKSQLMVMGDIYLKSQIVSVFLPQSDTMAYDTLGSLAAVADTLVQLYNNASDPEPVVSVEALSNEYKKLFYQWTDIIAKQKYWTRAWTFQEWTMAAEFEVGWEGARLGEKLQNIKNNINMASIVATQTSNLGGKDTGHRRDLTRLMEERAKNGQFLNLVRAHFPFGDFPVANNGLEPAALRRATFLPSILGIDSGMFVTPQATSKQTPDLGSRLGLALSAINISKREASKEADLVACWASMCNIAYPYNPDDKFHVALQKVVTALRAQGLPIYNFLANTSGGELDLKFLEYGVAHKQSNAHHGGVLVGSPIFTGRADTINHIKHLLNQENELVFLDPSTRITLQRIDRVVIKHAVVCSDKMRLLTTFSGIVSGTADGRMMKDVAQLLRELLDKTESTQLEKHTFVQVTIFVDDVATTPFFYVWGIIPSDIQLYDLEVARESLNGTLVLATYQGPTPTTEMQIVSYLNMTHQSFGTYLVKSDKHGVVDMVFRSPDSQPQDLFSLPELMADPSLGIQPDFPDFAGLGVMETANDQAFDVQISFRK